MPTAAVLDTVEPALVAETGTTEAARRKEANRKKRERVKAKKAAAAAVEPCTCSRADGSPCSSALCLLRKSGLPLPPSAPPSSLRAMLAEASLHELIDEQPTHVASP